MDLGKRRRIVALVVFGMVALLYAQSRIIQLALSVFGDAWYVQLPVIALTITVLHAAAAGVAEGLAVQYLKQEMPKGWYRRAIKDALRYGLRGK